MAESEGIKEIVNQSAFQGATVVMMAFRDTDIQGQGQQTAEEWSYLPLQVPHLNCPHAYIGESSRTFGDRIKEHLKIPSPMHQHSSTTGHPISPDLF